MEKERLDEGRWGEGEGSDRLDTAMLRSIIDALPAMLFVIDKDVCFEIEKKKLDELLA